MLQGLRGRAQRRVAGLARDLARLRLLAPARQPRGGDVQPPVGALPQRRHRLRAGVRLRRPGRDAGLRGNNAREPGYVRTQVIMMAIVVVAAAAAVVVVVVAAAPRVHVHVL